MSSKVIAETFSKHNYSIFEGKLKTYADINHKKYKNEKKILFK